MGYYPFYAEVGAEYRLVGPDGSAMVLNNPFDADYVGMATEVSGLDSPEVREAADNLTQSDGGVHGNFYYGRRPVVISGRSFNYSSRGERQVRMDKIARASNALRGDATLSWKPAERFENRILNPNIEIDATNHTNSGVILGAGATVSRVTTQANTGTASLQVLTTASTPAGQGAIHNFGGYLNKGQSYVLSFWGKVASGTGTVELLASGPSGFQSVSCALTTTWTRFSLVFIPNATGTWTLGTRRPTGASGALTWYMDSLMLSEGTAAVAYFDGDTTGYFWNGTPGASASGDYIEMFTTLRRQAPLRITGAWVKEFQIPMVSQYAPLFASSTTSSVKAGGTANIVENRGSAITYPILRITGSVANPKVSQTVRGDASASALFKTTGLTLAGGEVYEFDMLNHTGKKISDGSSANRYIDFTNILDWPSLAKGSNTLTLTDGGGSAAGTLEIIYRDAWV